jgi:putative nucleotidyltransferase with HDIG domain
MKDLREEILSDIINQKIFAFGKDSSIKLYLVGGHLRNLLMGIDKEDRDYVVEGKGAWNLAKKLASVLNGSFVGLDQERDIARIVIEGRTLDFSGTLGKSIEEDLERRDFTINSIAWSPERGFIDPFHGMKDIEQRIIRAIKKENMSEDPLRLIRAYRFGAELKFDIEPRTSEIITELSYLIPNVSGERISSEFFKILEFPHSFDYIFIASESKVLEAIFPELTPTRDIPPHGKHNLRVFDHSLDVVRCIEVIIPKLPDWVIVHLQEEVSYGISRLSVLKLGGLLHDIGKPLTWKITSNGRHRFIGHGRAGAELIDQISERLKLSKNVIGVLKALVRSHLRPLHLIESVHLDKRILYRSLSYLGQDSVDITVLAMADTLSIGGTEEEKIKKQGLLLEILEDFRSYRIIPRLLTGDDLIKIFNIEQGPQIGKILKALKEAQAIGEVRDKEEAIEYVKRLIY